MALSRLKLEFEGEFGSLNEQLMRSLFMALVGDLRLYKGVSGLHWEDIGFQGSDPRTDVRGAGLLGIL